jgi:hypothetical protein
VKEVMDPLREHEELVVAVDHSPPCRHATAFEVAEDGLQHLGNATPCRRGIDMPERVALQRIRSKIKVAPEGLGLPGIEKPFEIGGIKWKYINFLQLPSIAES